MTGRRRSNPLGLDPRVYAKHGGLYYVHRDGRWEKLGTDVQAANRRARLYNDTDGLYGTMAYWLDMFVVDCEARAKVGTLAGRTVRNYRDALAALKTFFAPPMLPADIEPRHVQDFLAIGAGAGRPVVANRQKSCLSSCISWLIRTGNAPGLIVNPCMQVSGIRRNPEAKRDRYVTDEEYSAVFAAAPRQVRAMMELTYRTLQRPESDILYWTVANIVTKDGERILRVNQGKTGKAVDIGLSPDLDALLKHLVGEIPTIGKPLICAVRGKFSGKGYTYDGICAMLKRSIKKVNAERAKDGKAPFASFGFRDLKGKGATDMWIAGEPIERIQLLCGHEDKATTEIYVKQRWRETAAPNMVKMGA